MTSMKVDTSSSRTPKTAGKYDPQHCLIFLEQIDLELRDDWPEMHSFIHDGVVLHLGSGKKIPRDQAEITAVIEAADTAVAGLATPRRPATRSRTDHPLSPRASTTTGLTNSQKESYLLMPAVWHAWNKALAAFLRKAYPQATRRVLLRVCGDDGLHILEHLEQRGRAASGTALQLAMHDQLGQRELRGVGQPTVPNWESYAQDLQSIATAGGLPDDQLLVRLRAGVYGFPAAISDRAITASESASDPAGVISAVTAFLEKATLQETIAANRRATPDHRAALAVEPSPALAADEITARLRREQRGPPPNRPPGPPDPRMNVQMGADGRTATPPAPPGVAAMWAPFEHPPCANWRRGREGCDGRHHLPQCPLPRPTLAVTDAEHALLAELPSPPTLVATTAAVTSPATLDFSALFSTPSPVQMNLASHPTPVVTVAATPSAVVIAPKCAPCDEYDGYVTASESDDYDSYELADETI